MQNPTDPRRPGGGDGTPSAAAGEPARVPAPAAGPLGVLVRRPVTVLMLFVTLVGTGVLSYVKVPLGFLPDGFGSSSMTVMLPYPGAGPTEVHDQLTRPVEDALRTIPGISDIVSYSREDSARVRLSFDGDTDMDVAYGEVRERVERIRPQLPPEMDRFSIWRWSGDAMPIMWLGCQYDADAEDPFAPIEKVAIPRLEGIDGVANVTVYGIVDKAVRIFVDVEKVRGYGVDLYEVIERLQGDNFTMPAGRIDDGRRTFAVRVDARFDSVADIRDYPIRDDLVLSDIAEVVLSSGYRDRVSRLNGQPDVTFQISKESAANAVEVCTRVEQTLASFADDPRLAGLVFHPYFSQKEMIVDAIEALQSSAMWGGLFAIVVLWLFLRDVRMTLIAALAIPSSLLAALAATHFSGMTLNIVTLTGFTLAIGMLVDNAVVVIENIARRRGLGDAALDASARGAGEVGVAVLTATLTTISVFLPLVFMEGGREMRVQTRNVGLPITYSLLASLLVAMAFIPMFASRLMGRRGPPRGGDDDGRLKRAYRGTLRWVLDHRFAATMLVLVVFAGAMSLWGRLESAGDGGGGGPDSEEVDVEVPSTYDLAEVDEVFRRYEDWLAGHAEGLGVEFYSAEFSRRGGELRLWPYDDVDPVERGRLADRLRAGLPRLPGVELTVGSEFGDERRTISWDLQGRDSATLAAITESVAEELETLTHVADDGTVRPLLENVRTDLERGLDEVRVRVDRDRASELGVSPRTVQGMVAWGLGGQRLPDLVVGDRDVRVQIEYALAEEESLRFLANLGLARDTGGSVPLGAVADFEFAKGPGEIRRHNGRTSMSISFEPNVDNLPLVHRRVLGVLSRVPLPEGYRWFEREGLRTHQEDMQALADAGMLSLLLVYLLMAILLESVVLPVAILVTVPLALIGVVLTLFVVDIPLGPMVVVGIILLVGVVVNNAIVLLDHVQRLRRAGHDRRAALLRGGTDRVRPILMTALTTIFGLLPMAAPRYFPGSSGEDSMYGSMAATVAGGLAFSTLLTLVVVPLFYTLFEDLGDRLARMLASGSADRRVPARTPRAAGAGAGALHDRRP